MSALFHEIYFSSSFSESVDWNLFFKIVLSQVMFFLIKAAVVYYSIYVLIPGWAAEQTVAFSASFKKPDRWNIRFLVRFILVLLAGALLMRLITQAVIWPHIFQEERYALSLASTVARYLYSLFDLIPVAVTAVAIKLVQLQLRALKQESVLVQEKLKSELLYLKSQTNPHFLFNTLNSIYVLSRKQDSNTPEAILHLSKILRYILYEPIQRTNPISKEIDLIRDYIALQKLRFQEHAHVDVNVAMDEELREISPLLLLPLVENAFKHSNDTEIHVQIELALKEGILDFTVVNTLSDEQEREAEVRDGIGLSNMKRQLAILYKRHTFDVYKKDGQFKVHLHIDLTSLTHV
jgi:two-component system LytT family sensor kinase